MSLEQFCFTNEDTTENVKIKIACLFVELLKELFQHKFLSVLDVDSLSRVSDLSALEVEEDALVCRLGVLNSYA